MNKHKKLLAWTGLVATLSLAGCWGGNNDDDKNSPAPPPITSTDVPDSAGVSTSSFVSFILSLSGSDESSEPLTIKDTLAVPADESGEPTPLN